MSLTPSHVSHPQRKNALKLLICKNYPVSVQEINDDSPRKRHAPWCVRVQPKSPFPLGNPSTPPKKTTFGLERLQLAFTPGTHDSAVLPGIYRLQLRSAVMETGAHANFASYLARCRQQLLSSRPQIPSVSMQAVHWRHSKLVGPKFERDWISNIKKK